MKGLERYGVRTLIGSHILTSRSHNDLLLRSPTLCTLCLPVTGAWYLTGVFLSTRVQKNSVVTLAPPLSSRRTRDFTGQKAIGLTPWDCTNRPQWATGVLIPWSSKPVCDQVDGTCLSLQVASLRGLHLLSGFFRRQECGKSWWFTGIHWTQLGCTWLVLADKNPPD